MINTAAENLNIEKRRDRAPKEVKEYIPWKKNLEEDKQTDTTELDKKLIEQYENTEKIDTPTNTWKQEKTQKTTSDKWNNYEQTTTEAVNALNRPKATEWLEKSYTDMETTIKESPNDTNRVARQLGKAMKSILNK